MAKKAYQPVDGNNNPVAIMALSSPHDVDGTSASTQSNAIDGYVVRIVAITTLRFEIGANPTATATSHLLSAGSEIWMPILPTQKVAVYLGKANIATAGI